MLFKWKGANKKSHQKWDFIVNLVLWLVKQRVTWPFSGDFWRKTTTNHHKLPRNHHRKPPQTTTNHYEPPWTTTNHHKPPQSLIQNEIWYWILDSDWLNSGSHDIFLRILEKNYHGPPQTTMKPPQKTTMNHHKPLWTTTNHYEPPRTTTNHHKPPRTTTNHHKPPQTTTNHHKPPQSLIQNEIWYWILDSDWLNSGSHDIFLRILEKNYHEPLQTTTNHHKPPQTTTNHYKPPQTTMNHHEVSFKMRFDTESWTLIG